MSARKRKSLGKRFIRWLILVAFISAFVLVVGVWFTLFDKYIHPGRMANEGTPADLGLEYESISFATEDGLTLQAWLLMPPAEKRRETMPTVVAVHGYGTCRWDILERCASFARAGYMVFVYDQRGCGDSEGDYSSGGVKEWRDCLLAIQQALHRPEADEKRLVLYGFSMGSVVAILAGASDKRVDAIIADSPYTGMREISAKILADNGVPAWPFVDLMNLSFQWSFGAPMDEVDTIETAPSVAPRPLLILVGDADTTVPPEHPQRVFAAASEPKKLVVMPGHGHHDNGSAQMFERHILPFLVEHLGPPVPPAPAPETGEEEEPTE